MRRIRGSRGFALMLAAFLIVTLSAIGVYLVKISTEQAGAVTQDERAARALQAARTGLEWSAYRILREGQSCSAVDNQTLSLPFVGPGFAVTVRCNCDEDGNNCGNDFSENEGGTSVLLFRLSATGCNNATCPPDPLTTPVPTYVERQLHLTLAR